MQADLNLNRGSTGRDERYVAACILHYACLCREENEEGQGLLKVARFLADKLRNAEGMALSVCNEKVR